MAETTAVVKYDATQFALTDDVATGMTLAEALQENFGGEKLSPSDLDRIKVPSGGGTMWEIPTAAGPKDVKELDCVIIYSRMVRSYYATEFTGGNNPPDCYSADSLVGIGDPGGSCLACPNSQWESDPKGGKGKACKERRLAFLLLPGDSLPTVLRVPPSSLKAYKQYLIQLTKKKAAPPIVVTRMVLVKDKNEGGIAYSAINFQFMGLVPDPAKYLALARDLKPLLDQSAATFVQESDEEDCPI